MPVKTEHCPAVVGQNSQWTVKTLFSQLLFVCARFLSLLLTNQADQERVHRHRRENLQSHFFLCNQNWGSLSHRKPFVWELRTFFPLRSGLETLSSKLTEDVILSQHRISFPPCRLASPFRREKWPRYGNETFQTVVQRLKNCS